MNTLATVDEKGIAKIGHWTHRQIETMRRSICPDANDAEFNYYIQYAVAQKLDPFLGHVILNIYNKNDDKKRRATIIVTQAGQRVIASRCRDYRPAEQPTEYEYDTNLKGSSNPLGLVKATVRLKKQDNQSTWFDVIGEAFWDEFAPLRPSADCYEWIETGETYQDSGKPKKRKQLKRGVDPSKAMVLDDSGQWAKMPRVMLQKCATMQALRAGWPEQFSGVYGEEEMERANIIDVTASELAELSAQERRAGAIGMGKDEYGWVDSLGELHFIGAGQYADHVIKEMRESKHTGEFESAKVRNREGLQRFWAMHKADALDLNAALEEIRKKLPAPDKAA